MKPKSRPPKSRIEKDSLGAKKIPADAYYGIQTARAVENFPVSGIGAHPLLVRAYVLIKRAAALTHEELGVLDKAITQPIAAAADEVLAGELADQFVVDVFQAGAGTSFNMNVNEVLANRALEIMGKKRGDYRRISPNDHVNCSQSTNDTFPTAMHLSALLLLDELLPVLHGLAKTFSEKGVEFNGIIKSGRTHLQDAVPVTLGQEFTAYGLTVERGTAALKVARERLEELAIGGSAVGTALNVPEGYRAGVIARLNEMTGLSLRGALDLREAMQCRAAVTGLSATLRTLSLDLIRIANDLRLLSSGPRTGLAEIKLPAVQPGSSIMPGKVNPVMAECLNMVCFQVVGNDLTISMAAQAGQMELNVMMPVMIHNLLSSMEILKNFIPHFSKRCVAGIAANDDRCKGYFEQSVGLATILNTHIGYLEAAELAKESEATGTPIGALILKKGLLSAKQLKEILDLERITGQSRQD